LPGTAAGGCAQLRTGKFEKAEGSPMHGPEFELGRADQACWACSGGRLRRSAMN
jgi:hypothetical protein